MTDVAVAELTRDEARALTDDIKGRVVDLLPRIQKAFNGRADKALGYDSWHEYCTAELDDLRIPLTERPAKVAELRQSGMSIRAISSALGVGVGTVSRDLATVPSGTVPDRIVSLDGKERPATQPVRPEPAPEPDAIDDVPLPFDEPEPEGLHAVETPAVPVQTPEQKRANAEFVAAVRESAERQQQEVLEMLAKQEASNAFGRACDGLLSAVSYAAAFRPPAEIPAERIDQFIARTERLLETARTWKEQTA